MNIIQRALLRVAYWLIRLVLPREVMIHACFNVAKIDPTPHTGGEKHHLVYAKLRQQFTTIQRRVLSLAVEAAVDKL